VLVQTNHGGVLRIGDIPAGQLLDEYYMNGAYDDPPEEGSCMMVVATDAPLDSRNLKRLAKRTALGIARTGGFYSNGSGDFVIAFSTAADLRIPYRTQEPTRNVSVLWNQQMSSLFMAAAEACEEAILNSLFKAKTTEGNGRTVEALPLNKIKEFIKNR